MPTPLKRKDQQGVPYVRPAEIEVWISTLERMSPGERLSQFALPKKSLNCVPSEVLVYFLRRAWAANDRAVFESIFRLLLARADRSLRSRLWDSEIGNASDICDEIVSRFVLAITNDCHSDEGLLDFYEIRFDQALCSIRASVLRKFYSEVGDAILVPFESQDPDGASLSAEVETSLDNYLSGESNKMDDPAFRIALFSAIDRLPLDQRQVIGLRLRGVPVQSSDPSVMTIARMLQCDDRTVRNRSTRALRSLKAILEEEIVK